MNETTPESVSSEFDAAVAAELERLFPADKQNACDDWSTADVAEYFARFAASWIYERRDRSLGRQPTFPGHLRTGARPFLDPLVDFEVAKLRKRAAETWSDYVIEAPLDAGALSWRAWWRLVRGKPTPFRVRLRYRGDVLVSELSLEEVRRNET